eukprot:1156795-Pelagomonas_calceolata.AAC.2
MHSISRGLQGGGFWARGGGVQEEESPGIQEHGGQPSRSSLALGGLLWKVGNSCQPVKLYFTFGVDLGVMREERLWGGGLCKESLSEGGFIDE